MELISYALDFVSFIIQNTKNIEKIKSIILFGSAARGEATKKSDIDIFIEVIEGEKEIDEEIQTIKNNFLDSIKFRKYWKMFNIENEINIITGKLDEWKLKDSMLGSSLILYQQYAPKLENGKNKAILVWENLKPNSKRVMLNKNIFGYNYYEKFYRGLIQKYGGRKLGANVILVSIESINIFLKMFHKFKVPVKIIRIFEYE